MSQSDFARQVVVAFEEEIVPAFEDLLILSKKVSVRPVDDKTMERSGDVIWRPMPYIAVSEDGSDATGHFKGLTDLVVPATLGFRKHVAKEMDELEVRDDLRQHRFGKAAAERLAADVNMAVVDAICNQGTLIATKSTAAAGFEDPADVDSVLNRNGIPQMGRQIAYSTKDYNGLAKNLADRGTMTSKPTTAYERALIGENVSGFVAHKLDYANICNDAAATGITMDTRSSASNYHVPKAKSVATTGEVSNFDNRRQRVTVNSTTSVAAGDWFTIAGIYEVHKANKRNTGELKTFRVISVDDSTHMTISPPIISNQGGSQAEKEYQNCVVPTAASNAALVWLNTTAKPINPFWVEGAVELLPARVAVSEGAGLKISRATTEQGIELVMTESVNHATLKTWYRWDIFFGVAVLQPEMVGGQIFSQT
ncbi:MAG: P22 phage major capsid protein family protein [Elusimicrobiota bacterium]|jgi:hypothetical protein